MWRVAIAFGLKMVEIAAHVSHHVHLPKIGVGNIRLPDIS
jgi:hypothetical protein